MERSQHRDLDVHLNGSGRVHDGSDILILATTTDLAPFGVSLGRSLKVNIRLIQRNT